jgi:Tol biopolymer transport system component
MDVRRAIGTWLRAAVVCVLMGSPAPAAETAAAQSKAQPPPASASAAARVEEVLIGEIPPGERIWGARHDGRRLYWRLKRAAKWVMVVDGQPGPEFDDIPNWAGLRSFSPDGQHFAYAARSGPRWLVMLDGKELGAGQPSKILEMRFSPDGQHLAYQVGRGLHRGLYVDGKEVDPQHGNLPVWSPDGRRWAYWTFGLYDSQMVEDGRQTEFHALRGDARNFPVFSPDGRHLAYRAHREKGTNVCIVVDGEVRNEYGDAGQPVFSPDGLHLAYAFGLGTGAGVELDGKVVSGGFHSVLADPVFSPDGEHLAFIATLKDQDQKPRRGGYISLSYIQVLDGALTYVKAETPTATASGVHGLTFSPDSRQLAYVVHIDKKPNNTMVILDGQQHGPEFRDAGAPVFSADGRYLAFSIRRGEKTAVVVDARESKAYDRVLDHTLTFAADGKGATYVASEGTRLYRVTQPVE